MKTADIIHDICELVLIVFLLLGLMACGHRIRELETRQNDKALVASIESDESRILACGTRVTSLEKEVEMLHSKIRDMDVIVFLITNKTVEVHKPVTIVGAVDDLVQ